MSGFQKDFVEAHCDYQDPETGNIAIDAWTTTSDEEEDCGTTVAWVTPDGEVIQGEHYKGTLTSSLIQETIQEAITLQKKFKEELIGEVLCQIQKDCAERDLTAIEELLMSCKSNILKAYLPEK